MNFVTQPSVELYKSITNQLHASAHKLGIEKTKEWQQMRNSARQARWRGRVTLFYDSVAAPDPCPAAAPEIYEHPAATPCEPRNRICRTDLLRRLALLAARARSAHAVEPRRGVPFSLTSQNSRGCLRRSGHEPLLS